MQILNEIINNFSHPAMLAFVLGLLAVVVKSDLEIPPQISKFLSLYLLFHIGVQGGQELYHSGINLESFKVLLVCALLSFITPLILFKFLRTKLNVYDAGAVAASYGSISAVNFIAAASILDSSLINYSGHMVAAMALMESPAIISGLLIIGFNSEKENSQINFTKVAHEALFNGSVFLLLGSLLIGFFSGDTGATELKPFVHGIFKGMLSFYMLDMGLIAGQKVKKIKGNILFLGSFALLYPVIFSIIAIVIARLMGLGIGDAFLFTVLVSSASFIAVPASMRLAAPKANLGIMISMSLGITFVFNIIFGAALYLPLINYIWQLTGEFN